MMQGHRPIEVRVTRYALKRVQLGQLLVPVAIGVGILARRFPEVVSPYLVFALYGGVLAVVLSGIRRLGKRTLRVEDAAIELGDGLRVARSEIAWWAMHRELVRLYGDEVSFRLRAHADDVSRLAAQLTQVFGPGQVLQPRGSLRARRLALAACLLGVLLMLSVFVHGKMLVLLPGIVCTLLGGASYATLRQRVLRLQ
jgi:hypothetical protein